MKLGDVIILDIGCIKDNYCVDMIRIVFYKEIFEKGREIFEIVFEVNKRVEVIVKLGVRFCDIDVVVCDYIIEKGYG